MCCELHKNSSKTNKLWAVSTYWVLPFAIYWMYFERKKIVDSPNIIKNSVGWIKWKQMEQMIFTKTSATEGWASGFRLNLHLSILYVLKVQPWQVLVIQLHIFIWILMAHVLCILGIFRFSSSVHLLVISALPQPAKQLLLFAYTQNSFAIFFRSISRFVLFLEVVLKYNTWDNFS